MNQDLPVDVMLKEMDDVQFTSMPFSNWNHRFSDQQLIDASAMKLKRMGGMYVKAIVKWGHIDQALKTCNEFQEVICEEFKKSCIEELPSRWVVRISPTPKMSVE